MTVDQRDILRTNLDTDEVYDIVTIEYPSHADGAGMEPCLKIVTRMKDGTKYADWYAEDGRTVDTRSWREDPCCWYHG